MSIAEARDRLNTIYNLLGFVDADKRFKMAIETATYCMSEYERLLEDSNERNDPNGN